MNKTFKWLLPAALLCSLTFTSCKKDYTCACNVNVTVLGFSMPASSSTTIKDTKKKAQKQCDDAEKNLQTQISGYGTASCTLK